MSICKLFWLVLSLLGTRSQSFSIVRPGASVVATMMTTTKLYSTKSESSTNKKRPRSRVSDPSGPTPQPKEDEMETVNVEDITEMQYDEDCHPVPHQPWRRGLTVGCEDPIDAEWRQQAEEIIRKSVQLVGGRFIDVTWYLTQVIVFVDDKWDEVETNFMLESTPTVYVDHPTSPEYKHPADPDPEDLWSDDEDIPVYERDDKAEKEIKSKMYARKEADEEDLGLDENEDQIPPLYANEETRADQAFTDEDLEGPRKGGKSAKGDKRFHAQSASVDTQAVAVIGGAILDALEQVEDELHVLERHEVVLASTGPPEVLETQKQFDAHRGDDVAVETEDPWESNRTLRGKLVDRNSMDVIINQKGRMVTIPLNFVRCVRLKYFNPEEAEDNESEMLP